MPGLGSVLFIARYSCLAAAAPCRRVTGLPTASAAAQVEILSPTLTTEISNPATLAVRWSTEWKRWDGLKYTSAFADDFAESEAELRYVPLYSRDGGRTWFNMLDDSQAQPGELPRNAAGAADASRTLTDLTPSGNETF
jgi:hypothetical protein